MKPLLIVGAGDHARVIAELARSLGREPAGFVEPSPRPGSPAPPVIDGLRVLGTMEAASRALAGDGADFVVAVGDNAARAELFARSAALGWTPVALVHPSAIVLGGASVADGAQVCAGAIIGVGAAIGLDAIVNTGATVDHDGRIGDHAFIGPGAHLAGRVRVEAGAHVGIGAVVREGCTIGGRAYVAAGAVVIRDVAPAARVAGVPARPMSAPSAGRSED